MLTKNRFAWPAVDPRPCQSESTPCFTTETDDRLILVTERSRRKAQTKSWSAAGTITQLNYAGAHSRNERGATEQRLPASDVDVASKRAERHKDDTRVQRRPIKSRRRVSKVEPYVDWSGINRCNFWRSHCSYHTATAAPPPGDDDVTATEICRRSPLSRQLSVV